jgi:hypothetical protein
VASRYSDFAIPAPIHLYLRFKIFYILEVTKVNFLRKVKNVTNMFQLEKLLRTDKSCIYAGALNVSALGLNPCMRVLANLFKKGGGGGAALNHYSYWKKEQRNEGCL